MFNLKNSNYVKTYDILFIDTKRTAYGIQTINFELTL